MRIYNFSYPLTQGQLDNIAAWFNAPGAGMGIIEVKVQLDFNNPLQGQCSNIAN